MRQTLKKPHEIEKMRQAGLVVWAAHQAAAEVVEPGATTADINDAVERVIAEHGGEALFKEAPGKVPFPAATCTSVNDEIVHGIPGPRRLEEGDVVSIDIGVRLDGWCGDAAVTRAVGEVDEPSRQLLEITEGCLRIALEQMGKKPRWRKVAKKMQSHAEAAGFSVVEELVGHGIGKTMWERPQVPNYFTTGLSDIKLVPGVVLAVEPMINIGKRHIRHLPDHWTIATADGSRSAHFEHTIAITEDGPVALTAGPDGQGWALG